MNYFKKYKLYAVNTIFLVLRALFKKHHAANAVLVVEPLPGIGDLIWHLPYFHALAQQEGYLSLLTKRRSFADQILIADSSIRKIIWLDRDGGRHDGIFGFWRLVKEIRGQKYSKVWILHNSSRYAWAMFCAGIPEIYCFGKGVQKYISQQKNFLSDEDLKGHPIQKADKLFKLLSINKCEKEPVMVLDRQTISKVSKRYGIIVRSFVAIGIGSSESFKQWGATNFAKLVMELYCKNVKSLFIIGGPAEREVAQEISAILSEYGVVPHFVLGERLDEVAALLSMCKLYVGNDTGILNMAAAVGIPSIGLFGGTEPLFHSKNIYPVVSSDGTGMKGVKVEMVMDAINRYSPTIFENI